MRYLKMIGKGQYQLENDRQGSFELFFDDKLISKANGNIEIELESSCINPVVHLIWEDGLSEYVGVQHIENVGIVNFRDIGGYPTSDGKQVKWRTFYRSAPITSCGQDLDNLETLNIKSILDFRSHWEVKQECDIDLKGSNYYHYSAMKSMDDFVDHKSGSLNIKDLEEDFAMRDPKEMMKGLYRDLIFGNQAYQEMFKLLLDGQVPMVFHCSAGKDRTGIAAAFIMLALGVDREIVVDEYMLTNRYRREVIEEMAFEKNITFEEASVLQGVSEEYIQLVFDQIDENYPNMETYFEKELLLGKEEIEKLKSLYTY